jgi:hypothetical protein
MGIEETLYIFSKVSLQQTGNRWSEQNRTEIFQSIVETVETVETYLSFV